MAKKDILITTKERRSVGDVAVFLRQLADRLEQNEISLQRGDDEISIELPNRITFKVKAKKKDKKRKTKHQFKITLKWKEGDKKENLVQVA